MIGLWSINSKGGWALEKSKVGRDVSDRDKDSIFGHDGKAADRSISGGAHCQNVRALALAAQ